MMEIVNQVQVGDFINGLNYNQLLEVENKIKVRIKNARMIMTDNGGFVSTAW